MANKVEQILVNPSNSVYELAEVYVQKTVKAYVVDTTTNTQTQLMLEELGDRYIVIDDTLGSTLIYVSYTYKAEDLGLNKPIEYELRERVVALESALESLLKVVQAQKKAIDNRVNITSFQAWTNLIEKKIGMKLIEGNLNHISYDLFKDSK